MKVEKIDIILFLFFSALLTTIWGYQFGQMDHVEHLPIIFRAENPGYLPNDGFLNGYSENYDPRFYYTHLILLLKQLIALPYLFFLLSFAVNYLIAIATFRIAKFFFGEEKWAGLIAVLLVMTVPTAELGSVSEIHTPYLTPNALAFSLILFSLSFIFKQKWQIAGLLLGLAALIHPLAGPECSFVFFSIGAIEQFRQHAFQFRKYKAFFIGMGIALILSLVSIAPYLFQAGTNSLESILFIDIYAHFRAPHHVLPSVFLDFEEKKLGLKLFSLLIFGWIAWYKLVADKRKQQTTVLIYILFFLTLAAAGYIFVEIYPVKLVVIAQTFRLLYVLKWFLWVLIGGYLGAQLWKGTHLNRIYAWAALFSSFAPGNLLLIMSIWAVSALLHRRFNLSSILPFEITAVITLGTTGWYLAWQNSESNADVYLWAFMLLALPVTAIMNFQQFQKIIWPLAAVALLMHWNSSPRTSDMKALEKAISRQFSLNDLPETQLELAKKIKELTPQNAILIVPPMMGELRYLAERALLVTFKTLPFGGKQMLEWKQTVFDCYGWTDLKGFNAVLYSFEPNYKKIDKEKLSFLRDKYQSEYAVIYKETKSEFPVLYENNDYQLIFIGKIQK